MEDRIERSIQLNAPVARVWRALTDHQEFGAWFQVALDGPFVTGEVSTGQITYPGCEHMKWIATVTAMDEERLFAFTWSNVEDPGREDTLTLVEFKLEANGDGTRLEICESGFASLPDDIDPAACWRRNSGGWDQQVEHIRAHVDG